MRKILVVSGCSWTDKDFQSTFHPEIDCSWPKWPELLAKKLDMDCINLGLCGHGSEYIYSTLLEQIISMDRERIGLVIAAWSKAQRRDFKIRKRWRNLRYDAQGDMDYYINRSMNYYFSFQTLCEKYKIPYRQVQMIEILEWTWFDGETIRFSEAFPEKWNLKDISESILKSKCHNYIDENNFIGWPILHNFDGFCIRDRFRGKEKKLIITDEDGHPNEEGQKFIAELIYDNL
tara:strand:+ start:324 stop:1022 length:699 start_codon:yes stop_codon:yes gene_type:complete